MTAGTTGDRRRVRAPGPRGGLLGHLAPLERDPLEFLTACRRDYGDVVRLRFFLSSAYLLAHPDHVRHVLQDRHSSYDKRTIDWKLLKPVLGDSLLTTDGAYWLRQRRLMQPAFHRKRIEAFGRIMTEEATAMLGRWEARPRIDEPLDVVGEMTRLTLDVVTRALFGTEVGDQAGAVGEAVTTVNASFREHGFKLSGLLAIVTGRPHRSVRPAMALLDRTVHDIIARRRRDGGEHDDLLAMLLAARDDDTGEAMTDRQLRNEVLTLFAAGHETTSNALSWTFYLLSHHPETAERLRAELAAVLGGRVPTVDDLPSLAYTRMVVEESMRLYPPAWATSRNAAGDDELGGYHIRKGSLVVLSPWVTHRHPAFWDDPERFDPERFTPDRVAARPRFAYFPFGGGPHLCIGNSFAMTEAILILATVAQRWHWALIPGHRVEPEPMVTLRPRGGLPMRLRPLDRGESRRRSSA
jgi:cytochrome P450